MTCLEELSGDRDPRFQGEPNPSRTTVRLEVRETVGGYAGTGVLWKGMHAFAQHLSTKAAKLREHGSSDPLAHETLAQPVLEMAYRTAADASACSVKLTIDPRTGTYGGDEDLSSVNLGKDPRALAT